MIKNLKVQGFAKIYLIAGHSGSGQIDSLRKAVKNRRGVYLINPWENISVEAHHADEYETSVLWACRPEEEKRGRSAIVLSDDDCFQYYGRDVRKKASLRLGKKILNEAVNNSLKLIK